MADGVGWALTAACADGGRREELASREKTR